MSKNQFAFIDLSDWYVLYSSNVERRILLLLEIFNLGCQLYAGRPGGVLSITLREPRQWLILGYVHLKEYTVRLPFQDIVLVLNHPTLSPTFDNSTPNVIFHSAIDILLLAFIWLTQGIRGVLFSLCLILLIFLLYFAALSLIRLVIPGQKCRRPFIQALNPILDVAPNLCHSSQSSQQNQPLAKHPPRNATIGNVQQPSPSVLNATITGNPTTVPDHRILLLVERGEYYKLAQISLNGLDSQAFFNAMRVEYFRLRGFARNWFSVYRFSHCDFYKV